MVYHFYVLLTYLNVLKSHSLITFDPCVHYLGLLANSVGMPRVEIFEKLLSLWHLNYLIYLLVKISCIFNQDGMQYT